MDKIKIYRQVRQLKKEMYKHKDTFWPNGQPNPVEMINPDIVAQVLGLNLSYVESLGDWGFKGQRFEIAGLIDRQSKKISVSNRFPIKTKRF